ncbi:hypothetical protein SUGI_0124620 [Cryptomeria japonica]|nr:hypothetical protein SUGI_0124620 [Cryptomeria japonica]
MSMLLRRQRLHARRSQCSLSMARSREGMEGFYLTYKILPYFPIQLAEARVTGEAGASGAERSSTVFDAIAGPRVETEGNNTIKRLFYLGNSIRAIFLVSIRNGRLGK